MAGEHVHHLSKNLYWTPITADNFELALELFLDTFTANPGNPIYKALGVGRAELESTWREKLWELVAKQAYGRRSGPVQMLFFYEGKAAAFYLSCDLHDEANHAAPPHPSAKLQWKQRIDQIVTAPALALFPRRGVFLHSWLGVNSKTGFDGLARIIDVEIRLQTCARGWSYAGSNTYNARSVGIIKRNGGQ
jgi:hypothetical protein